MADDTSSSFTSSNVQNIEGILKQDLRFISVWAEQWLVDFNPNKTEAIFYSCTDNNKPNLILNNISVAIVENHKHLGLTFSYNSGYPK
ncbi:MAG: hypothetical protein ACH254_21720 [Candidatus Thiodiazotropha endolucinida]